MSRMHLAAAVFSLALGAATPAAVQAQAKDPISVTFFNAPLRDVLAGFAKYGGRTIVMKAEIGDPLVNASFTNVPWEDALAKVLEQNGLVAKWDPAGILVIEKRPRTETGR